MPTLLCTSKYRRTFKLPERLVPGETSEGALGPWYANTLNVGHLRMLHYMSGPSLLSVFIGLRERASAERRFILALAELLTSLGVEERYVASETAPLSGLQYGRASDRSKLGSLRDQAYLAGYHIERGDLSLAEMNVLLAETPCGPMNYASPDRVAPELLERTWRWAAQ